MRKESKEMAVTAATMKKEKRNEPAATTFVNYLESWYQNKCLSNSTSSSTAAYYYWMIFNVIEPSLPDKERAVDDIDAEYLNALLACINQKNENTAASAYRFLRVFIKDSFEPDTGDYELFFQIKKYSVLEKDPVLYTPEQLTCLLSAAKKDNTSHYLFYPELVGTIMPMAGGSVSQKIIYGILKIIPGGAGQAVTCSTSGMGFRLK